MYEKYYKRHLVSKYMIFKNKTEISRYLKCGRQKVYDMIKRKEIKEVYIGDIKCYVIVLEFIKFLLD